MKNKWDTPIHWDDLRVFLAISTGGSLTRAAERLGVSVATAGRRLDRLEVGLGVTLFERHASGLTLTEVGASLVDPANQVLDGVLSFVREAEIGDQDMEGTVRVSTLTTIAHRVIAPRLGAFRARFADISIVVMSETRIVPLSDRTADIALRVVRPTEDRVITRRVGTIPFGLYAGMSYLKSRGRPDSVDDLRGHDIITYSEHLDSLPEVLWFRSRTESSDLAVRLASVGAMREAALGGAGLVILPLFMGDGLVELHRGGDLPERNVWIAAHEDVRNTSRVAAVWDFLCDCVDEVLG